MGEQRQYWQVINENGYGHDYNAGMRYSLRTLVVATLLLPPVLAALSFRSTRQHLLDIMVGGLWLIGFIAPPILSIRDMTRDTLSNLAAVGICFLAAVIGFVLGAYTSDPSWVPVGGLVGSWVGLLIAKLTRMASQPPRAGV